MKKFDVNISVQVWRDLEIDAENKQEAEEKAKEIMNADWTEGEMEYNTMEIGFINEIEKKTYQVKIEYLDGQKKNMTIVDYPTNVGFKYFVQIAKGLNPGIDILKLDWVILTMNDKDKKEFFRKINFHLKNGLFFDDFMIEKDEDGDLYISEKYIRLPIRGWSNDGACDYEARFYVSDL